jgi:membrane fusion protein (multidrug efflux system)
MSGATHPGAIPGQHAGGVRLNRKFLIMAGASLLTLAAIAYGANYWVTGQYQQSTDDAYVGGDVSALAPQVSGLIAAVAVTDNETVHAGQLLVQLDDRPYRAALAQADANVAGAKAALANLNATENLQQSVIAEAQTDITAADAAVGLARLNQSRYARLAASSAGTEQDAQTANATLAQNTAAAQKTRAALAAETARLAVIETQKTQAQASLAGAQASRDVAVLDEQYTRILAPFDGVVGDRAAHVGDYASAGSQLLSLVPTQGLWVDANFKEDQLAHMQPGQNVTIVADIAPGVKITGHVGSLSPASGAVFSLLPAQNATGNFTKIVQRVPVRVLLDGNAATLGLLRPGLSVTATVDTK